MFDYQSVSKVSIFLSVELLMLEYSPGLTPSSRMVCGSGTGLLPPRNSCYFLQKMPQLRALAASPSHQNHQRAASTSKETLADLGSQRRGNVFTVGCFRSTYVDSFHFNGDSLGLGAVAKADWPRPGGWGSPLRFSLCWIYIIWRFPEMGVPPNDLHRIFHYKPSSYWGTPIYGNPHMIHMYIHTTIRDG